MSACVPIEKLKSSAAFARAAQEADGPATATGNGVPASVSTTQERYDALRPEVSRARLYDELERGEADARAGRVIGAREVISGLRERHGL